MPKVQHDRVDRQDSWKPAEVEVGERVDRDHDANQHARGETDQGGRHSTAHVARVVESRITARVPSVKNGSPVRLWRGASGVHGPTPPT